MVTPTVIDKTLLLGQTNGGGDAAPHYYWRDPHRVRWHLNHRWMVRRSGVDALIITAGWYAEPTLIGL